MASDLEPVPVTSQKHDPAWKHCQMYKNGERIQLKCIYCGKMFKGGGIHRIKEHLAGQKGNASSCLRVQPDVRLLMQESLNGVVLKKRKKQLIAEEIINYNAGSVSEVDTLGDSHCGLNTEVNLLPAPDTIEQNPHLFVDGEEGLGTKNGGRKKKGRVRKASTFVNPNAIVASSNAIIASKKVNNHVHMAIGQFLFDAGVPLDAVNSVYFQPMIDAIASQGPGVSGPSYHDLRSWILRSTVQEVRNDIDQCTGSWGKSGCSILVEECISGKGKTLLRFFVYCSEGTIFLRSVDMPDLINSVDSLYNLLKEVVEEVGVRNVLQVITKGEEQYVKAGKRLTDSYPSLFWTPCACQCIDLMLEDIRKLDSVHATLEQAKAISRFIYNRNVVLNMMRQKTFGVDLVDLGVTRSATDFMTLKRMVDIKTNLQSTFTSEEWMESPYSKNPEAFAMVDYISDQSFWSACASIIQIVNPLLRLLRIVGSEKRPAMGYVYAGLYRAKETIKKEFVDKKDYSVYWDIIDHRWKQLQHHPLHSAGFYLNPKFYYSSECNIDHIRSSVLDCIEKFVPDPKIQDKVTKELMSYCECAGDFGRKMALRARDTSLPAEWWSIYGGGCPNLARLATRILSQTCSLMISCKQNQIPFEHVHETKNSLEHQRLCDLAFVQANLWLKHRLQTDKEPAIIDPISYENADIAGDWVIGKPLCSEDLETSDWMTVDPPIGNTMLLGMPIDDIEALDAGFDDYEIFNSVEENGE